MGPRNLIPRPTRSLPACAWVFRTVEGPTDCGEWKGRREEGAYTAGVVVRFWLPSVWESGGVLPLRWPSLAGILSRGEENGTMAGVPGEPVSCTSVARHCRHSCAWVI